MLICKFHSNLVRGTFQYFCTLYLSVLGPPIPARYGNTGISVFKKINTSIDTGIIE